MDHFAGLDVSVKETSVCVVDDTGKIVREVKVASEPEWPDGFFVPADERLLHRHDLI
jgi:predicted NBD/HSP70 family sugar kinase